ncbi:MAG: TIM-barrel domain-containing protein, partial [Lentisphaeria bacterium]
WLRHLPWLNHLYFEHAAAGGRRGLSFSRWAGWGDHRHPIHFSGDAGATWEMLRFEVPFTAVSGNAGCFFWAHDAGGFHSPQRDPELYTRWVQFCALSASLRLHSCGDHLDRRPWLWGEPFTTAMHAAFRLRSQLLPYVYSSAWQCHRNSVPLLRPLYLEYPRCEDAYRCPQEYLFGDHLLAAPVTAPGTGDDRTAVQSVWIPEGTWVDWFTGRTTTGPCWLEVATPLARIPLWVRAGVPLPLQPYTPRMTTEPLTCLVIRCTLPPADGECGSVLYEDDGQSDAYLRGAGAITPLWQRRAGNRLTLGVGPAAGAYDGQPAERAVEFHLHGYGALRTAEADGRPLAVETRDGVQILRLPAAAPATARNVVVELE